jgi:hypothetical protein
MTTNATKLTVGEFTWTNCGDDGEPALQLSHGQEVRTGDSVNAAYLRRLSVELMQLAVAVDKHEKKA